MEDVLCVQQPIGVANPATLVQKSGPYASICCPHLQGTLSKIVVLLYQNTLRHSPEDNRPDPNMSRLENIKFYGVRNDITD